MNDCASVAFWEVRRNNGPQNGECRACGAWLELEKQTGL